MLQGRALLAVDEDRRLTGFDHEEGSAVRTLLDDSFPFRKTALLKSRAILWTSRLVLNRGGQPLVVVAAPARGAARGLSLRSPMRLARTRSRWRTRAIGWTRASGLQSLR